MSTLMNRTTLVVLTNASGQKAYYGMVVMIDSASAASFNLTNTPAYSNGIIGVVYDQAGIENGASGLIALSGYVPKILLNSSAGYGDLICSSNVSGYSSSHSAPLAVGDFGQVLGTGASPKAILWGGMPYPQAGSSQPDYIMIQEQQNAGTDAGDLNSGWNIRQLNNVVFDDFSHVLNLAYGKFKLSVGTYQVRASAPAFKIGEHRLLLSRDGVIYATLTGPGEYSGTDGNYAQTRAQVEGIFTVSDDTVEYYLHHGVAGTQGGNGAGRAVNDGNPEIYSQIELWKLE